MNTNSVSSMSARKRGFTLLQILVVISLVGILSAVLFGVLTRGRATARRADCDVHLKEIALALDTFRQETGHMPQALGELVSKKYVSAQTLRCASDPDLANNAGNAAYSSYGDFYVIREPRDSGELPVVVCPFHSGDGLHGVQAYKGRYTAGFTSRPVVVSGTEITGAVTITRPGKGVLSNPATGKNLALRGGDRIKTGAGTIILHFEDGSRAEISANSEMRVLDSYIEGQRTGPLYSLTRQLSGRINYFITPGSHFDVATPTATAGALGTVFEIKILPDSAADVDKLPETVLTVTDHAVAISTVAQTVEIVPADGSYTVQSSAPVAVSNVASTSTSWWERFLASLREKIKKERKPRERGSSS